MTAESVSICQLVAGMVGMKAQSHEQTREGLPSHVCGSFHAHSSAVQQKQLGGSSMARISTQGPSCILGIDHVLSPAQ